MSGTGPLESGVGKWGYQLDVATLTSREYLHFLAEILEGSGDAGLTEHLERVLRESGVALQRQDIDRARKGAARTVRERNGRRKEDVAKAAQTRREARRARREAERVARIRIKDEKAVAKQRAAEEEAERKRQRDAAVQGLLGGLREDVALVGDMLDLTGLACVLGAEAAAKVAGHRSPDTWRLNVWPEGLTRVVTGCGDELVTRVVNCAFPVLPVARVWEEERNRLRYRMAYQLPDGRWRLIDLSPAFTAKDLVRVGLPILSRDSQKATMEYLAAFMEVNDMYEMVDTDGTDAMDYLLSWIRVNHRHFSGGDRKILGRFTRILGEAAILISRATLHAVLEQQGYCPGKVISSWRAKGFLINTTDGRNYHRQTLGGDVKEACFALRRTAIDPEYEDWQVNEHAIRASMRADGAPRTRVTRRVCLKEPVEVAVTLVPVTAEGATDAAREEIVVDRIIPGYFKGDRENTLAEAAEMAQAILGDPFRPGEDRKVIEVKGEHWLMKDRSPQLPVRTDAAREVAVEAAEGGSLAGDGAFRAGRGGGKSNAGEAQAWAAARSGS